jgi:hypothetical protein
VLTRQRDEDDPGEHNAQKLIIVDCAGCAHNRAKGYLGHIASAASKFTPNCFTQRKAELMKIRTFVAPLLLAAGGAAAIAIAPLAQADATPPPCSFTGNASVCQTEGNAQVSALPPTIDYQAQYPFGGYGGLLFHHRGRHG